MVWRCGAETSGVLGVFVNRADNFHHTNALCNLVGREHVCHHSSYFCQTGIFSPAEDDVVHARPLGAWESVVISAASSCRILARMVEQPREKILVIAMVTSPPPLSSQAGCGFPGRQVPEFIFPVIFPPSSSQQSHLTTAAATHLLSTTTIHHHHGRIRQSSAKWC